MTKRYLSVSLLLLLCIGLLGTVAVLAGCTRKYESNGEQIYFTATSSSGDPISYTGSITMMHSIVCANCHGADGHGGRVNMMMWSFETPNITWEHLTSDMDHEEPGAGADHEDHEPYTEETLKLAITEGIEPNGEELEPEMPRWKMSQSDLDDLIEFLKTLD